MREDLKIGDRIVAIQTEIGTGIRTGWNHMLPDQSIGTVTGVSNYGEFEVEFDNFGQIQFILPGCIYYKEEIWNSPLMQALREE